jgi:hypothetical protein
MSPPKFPDVDVPSKFIIIIQKYNTESMLNIEKSRRWEYWQNKNAERETLSQQSAQNKTERKYVPKSCKHLQKKKHRWLYKNVLKEMWSLPASTEMSFSVSIVT